MTLGYVKLTIKAKWDKELNKNVWIYINNILCIYKSFLKYKSFSLSNKNNQILP